MDSFAALDVPYVSAPPPPGLTERLRASLKDRDVAPDVGDASDDHVLAALAEILPEARALQRALGVPPDVTDATLRDVGSKHRLYGAGAELPWLLGILRGDVLSVGRLQVERRAGERGHALHVPHLGPLLPDAVNASLARAREVLGAEVFTCSSWLLDPVLTTALPETNIAAFASRFTLDEATVHASEAGAESVAKFVFGRSVDDVRDPAAVTPRTRLEELVVRRLREGSGWAEPTGVAAPSWGAVTRVS